MKEHPIVDVLVGAQYGSEAKGLIAAHIANNYDAHVRVGSIQSGHTTYFEGNKVVMRTIPSGWVNLQANLLIGPGAFIEPELLLEEISMLKQYDPNIERRLFIDYRVWCVTDQDKYSERGMAKKMGSTQEGAGAALLRKFGRKRSATVAMDDERLSHLNFTDVVRMYQVFDFILLEGSQGTGLGVHTSPYYPFCTARECTTGNWLAEAGIGPTWVRDVIGVARTFPIRVGGNSGPTGGAELSWEGISKIAGGHIEPEKTTVTQRVRRIFEFDDEEMLTSIAMNGITKLAVNFANYLDASVYGVKDERDLTVEVAKWFAEKEIVLGVPIKWTTTGPSQVLEFII